MTEICGRLITSTLPCVFRARTSTFTASEPAEKTNPPAPPLDEARPTFRVDKTEGATTPGAKFELLPNGLLLSQLKPGLPMALFTVVPPPKRLRWNQIGD